MITVGCSQPKAKVISSKRIAFARGRLALVRHGASRQAGFDIALNNLTGVMHRGGAKRIALEALQRQLLLLGHGRYSSNLINFTKIRQSFKKGYPSTPQ